MEGATSKWSEPSSDFSPVDLVKDLGFEVWGLWLMVYGAWMKV